MIRIPAPLPVEPSGNDLVGASVEVFWPDDCTFYRGEVRAYDEGSCKHRIEYTDGDVETIDLAKEIWRSVGIVLHVNVRMRGSSGAADSSSDPAAQEAEEKAEQGPRAAKRPRR